MDLCRAWFRKKGGLGRCSADISSRKCSSLPASARQLSLGFGFTSTDSSNSSSETPTQETPPTPRAHEPPKTLSKKERRELLKARVEALRSRLRDSSSDEEERATPTNRTDGKLHNRFHSDLALHRDVRKRLRRGRNPSRQTPEMRTWSLERGVDAPRRGPTPPPRSTELPPPPPVRHASSRPVSFGFENGYEMQRGSNVGQGPRSRTSYYPNQDFRSQPNTPQPSKTIPPAVPPRRGSLQINTSPHNLEDALQELENIYKSLKLADDSILDRADRRMLTYELPVNSIPTRGNFKTLSRNSVSGSYDSLIGGRNLTDDLAYRRFSRPSRSTTPALNPTGSYLLISPHLSPGTSTEDLLKRPLPRRSLSREPDAIRDDVTYRAMRDANNRHHQQPEGIPFGIPTGVPVIPNPTDYLRPGGLAKSRPTFQPRMTPDVVQDDMAMRSLRKDFGSHQKVNTDELDAILRNGSGVKPPTSGVARRKYRAVKSLSANISHMVQKRQPGLFFDDSDRTQSMTDILAGIASEAGYYTPPPVPPLPSRRALKNGNSTDTLTETDHDIWQSNVRLGPMGQQVVRRDAEWRSDTDGRRKGTPLDERSLDELLNSLAVDTDTEVKKKVQQGKDLSPVGKQFKVGVGREKLMGSTQSCTGKQDPSSKVLTTQTDESERIRPSGGGDGQKVERMAKYKEERRRQLASKYADWSSSEDLTSVGEEPSYMRLSNRYKKHQKSDGRVQNKNQSPDPGGTPDSTAIVRSNRASRLRAMAVGVTVQENGASSEFVRVGSLRSRNSDDTFQRNSLNRRSFNGSSSTPEFNGKISSQATSSSDYADNLESPRKLKDKSFKRKSNLNRSLVDSPVSTNDSTWRPAKKFETPAEVTALSEGSSFRVPDIDIDSKRKPQRLIPLKRPEIPEILRHSRLRDSEPPQTSPEIPNAYTVRFHVTETSRNGSGDAVERVQELTQLVKQTTEEMDTLTNAALNSDLISTSDSDAPHVTKTENSTLVTITAKPPSTPAHHQPTQQHVSRIRIKSAQVADSQVCQMEDPKTLSESDDDAYLTPAMDFDDETQKKSFSILKKDSFEELPSILRKRSSVDDGMKTQSILKAPHHVEEPQPRPILKKRPSIEENEWPRPILKAQRTTDEESENSGGEMHDGDKFRPILKKQQRIEEHPLSILKNSSSSEVTPPSTRKSSLVRRPSEDLEVKSDVGKEFSDGEKEKSDAPPLLPSILKKRTKDVHPLATPFTEFQSIIKARTPQEETRKPAVPVELVETPEVNGERRMSVAERIFQMETRLADDVVRKSGQSTPRGVGEGVVVVSESQISARLEQFSVVRSNRRSSPRFHTQPITMEEVVESKNVTNVEKLKQTFMSRVNGFSSDKENTPKPQRSPDIRKKFLFPIDKLSNTDDETPTPTFGHVLQRSRTQPVTLNEINDFQDGDKRKEKSSSDSEEDPCKMSLAERVKLFDQKVFEEKFSALNKKNTPIEIRNLRRTNPRFKTQPITWAEMENVVNDGEKKIDCGVVDVSEVKDDEEKEEMVAYSPPKVHAPVRVQRATILYSSSNDEDSSGPGYGSRRIIKNEAINRRRNAALRKKDERRSMCELDSSSFTEPTQQQRSQLLHQRSLTEPITKLDFEGIDDEGESEDVESKVSIADRLAALRKSGEENWKERIEVENGGVRKRSLVEIRESRRDREQRPSSIVDRISKLEIAQETWKQRVEEKDSAQFTVAGRMGCPELELPTDRVRCIPKPKIFKSETTDFKSFHQEREKLNNSSPVQRSASVPACNLLRNTSENNEQVPESRVSVPKADDESFHAFFDSVSVDKRQEQVEISEDGFKQVMSASHQMLVQRRDVVRQRRTAASSRNPVKALASRTDIQNEYVEIKTGVAEKEFKRVKTEQIAQNTSLAVSALAGLASKEDFTAISLRKGSSNISGPLLPFKDLMLMQIKGRRHVQTRLVKPCISSMNRGDNYILVTPREVFNWIGKFSNVIEKSKAADVLNIIQTKRDLGLNANAQVMIVDEEKHAGSSDEKRCLEILNGDSAQIGEAENPKEDELYETAIIDTNMAFEVEEDRLVPHAKCWGTLPKMEILDAKKVLVFDFGSEMYVWQGKLAPTPLRRVGIHLAQQLWDQGYNYSECSINPIHPTLNSAEEKRGQRPEWALFGKVNQHMETVLFKEKFVDWPDAQRLIRVKSVEKEDKPESPELIPCNPKPLLTSNPTEPDLILEGSHLGRGKSYFDADSRRHYEITTLGIKVWHVREKLYKLLPRESWGQFHSGDTYVVRWQYMVTVTGRNLAGQMSRHSFVGRERCAYFFWQGADSTVNDKGASALMTVELDEERGPHVRVDEGHEQPCFLSLFDGSMVVHRGKRKLVDGEGGGRGDVGARLFVVRGRVESEACLVEVEARKSSLRSRGSLVLVDSRDGTVCVWHGAKAGVEMRQVALCCAEIVRDRRPLEFGFECNAPIELLEVNEGNEDELFFHRLHGDGKYFTLLSSSQSFDFTPRLYHMSSVSGAFVANETHCAFRSTSFPVPFPFLQCDLYNCDQPALFLLDNEDEVYLWQGWWPEASDDNDNVATGSAKVRWNLDRRLAMESAIQYCNEKSSSPPNAYLVSAGLEPLRFTNIFPKWEVRDDVTALNSQDGKRPNDCPLVSDILPIISRSRYNLAELQSAPLPEGVDPSRIESYLNDSDFEEALGLSPTEFYVLPAWKQNEMKKLSSLF
uniref:HP domain-containing protein n=1 Tax=Strigamia maritima TaxID=126957 RepID=T1J6L1_STRMM